MSTCHAYLGGQVGVGGVGFGEWARYGIGDFYPTMGMVSLSVSPAVGFDASHALLFHHALKNRAGCGEPFGAGHSM